MLLEGTSYEDFEPDELAEQLIYLLIHLILGKIL